MSAVPELPAGVNRDLKKEEMLKLFFKLVDMTKYMVDGILPDILLEIDQHSLESMIKMCKELNVSLQAIEKWCGIIYKKNFSFQSERCLAEIPLASNKIESNDYSSLKKSNVAEDDSSDNHVKDVVWSAAIHEAAKKLDVTGTLINIYYCGFCNVRAMAIGIWISHLKGKIHFENCQTADGVKITCETCKLHVFANKELVDRIMDSSDHQSLDQMITKLEKENNLQLPEMDDQGGKERRNSVGERSCGQLKSIVQSEVREKFGIVTFKGTQICTLFVEWTSRITRYVEGKIPFTVRYCKPCNKVSESKDSWIAHSRSEKHVSLMANRAYHNVLCLCLQCQYSMVASKRVARIYMHFHIEQCHKQSSVGIVDVKFMEMRDILPKASVTKTNGRNGIGLKQSPTPKEGSLHNGTLIDDSIQQLSDITGPPITPQPVTLNEMPNVRTNGESQINSTGKQSKSSFISDGSSVHSCQVLDSLSLLGEESSHKNLGSISAHARAVPNLMEKKRDVTTGSSQSPAKIDQPSSEPAKIASRSQGSVDTGNDDPLSMFIELLRQKGSKYLVDRSFKPFGAICFVCNISDFHRKFEWFDHIISHESNFEQNEIECPQCNTVMFGNVKFIGNTLITQPYHATIDKMMAQ